jgi:hypothetical protein
MACAYVDVLRSLLVELKRKGCIAAKKSDSGSGFLSRRRQQVPSIQFRMIDP